MLPVETTKTQKQEILSDAEPIYLAGLPAAPLELLYKIAGYLPPPLIPLPLRRCHYISGGIAVNEKFLEQSRDLIALSQTCTRFRNALRPLVWKQVGVVRTPAIMSMPSHVCPKAVVTKILKLFELTTVDDPSLCHYVETLTVTLPAYSIRAVTRGLCRCLGEYYNLRTLQLTSPHLKLLSDYAIKSTFDEYSFPRVTTLATNVRTWFLVARAFPGLRNLYFVNMNGRMSRAVLDISYYIKTAQLRPELECIDGVLLLTEQSELGAFTKLIELLPALRVSPRFSVAYHPLWRMLTKKALRAMGACENLSIIQFQFPGPSIGWEMGMICLKLMKTAREVLAASGNAQTEVKVFSCDGARFNIMGDAGDSDESEEEE